MALIGILTEKASAARNFKAALGGMTGNYQGEDYVIVAARGHLYELKQPHEMVPKDHSERVKTWALEELPWDETLFEWSREEKKGVSGLLGDLGRTLRQCDTVVIASDIDPSGEGGLLAWEIIDELDLHDKKIERMEFVDEAPASIQKAFLNRRPVTSMWDEGEFRKAFYRSKFDLLSMQWTRVATLVAAETGRRAMLRNGRLKSAMVTLVGDGLKAHLDYRKVPFYQNRFRDENGVMYTNEDEPRFRTREEVPQIYAPSQVTMLSREKKFTKPPRLLDLAGLSALLAREGFKPDAVLSTYQKMYEAQVVSYPRTEDKFISSEQFKELEPKIDAIAAVVGVDPAVLTHRTPRRTHVKEGGAHGANRPGPNVPASLEAVASTYGALGRRIYEILARNYLTMLAEDYAYEQQKGQVTDFPDFTGIANVPLSLGWKGIFDAEAETAEAEGGDDADADSGQGLGTRAEPVVHEGFPPRPSHPTMSWLMKQLEKHDVGTGATRTSTFAEVIKGEWALLEERRGRITMTTLGELNHRLLPGTHIGDLELTKRVQESMAAIEAGSLDMARALEPVKDWVMEDLETMRRNAATLPDDLAAGLKTRGAGQMRERELAQGTWQGKEVTFNRRYGSHRFSDEEVATLLAGGEVTVIGTSDSGVEYKTSGRLAEQVYVNDEGKEFPYVGFKGVMDPFHGVDLETYAVGVWAKEDRKIKFKRVWGEIAFSDEHVARLLAGEKVEVAPGVVGELQRLSFTPPGKTEAIEYVGFQREVDLDTYAVGVWAKEGKEVKFKRVWSRHTFTEEQIADLLAGKKITFETTAASGNSYTASGELARQVFAAPDGRKVSYVGFKLDIKDKGGAKSGAKGGRGGRGAGNRGR